MSSCLEQIVEINNEQVKALRVVAKKHPNPDIPASCEAFSAQVHLVHAAVINTYSLGATLSSRAGGDLKKAAVIWETISDFCRTALVAVSKLKNHYPHCGTPELHDTLLEYFSQCQKRLSNVLEEISCQKKSLPKGLFPALS